LQTDNRLNWKIHIEQMILNLVQHIRSMVRISNINALKSIYYACFHPGMKYGVIFWGNSLYSGKIFTLQKKIVRIVAGVQLRTSCRSLVKQLEILPVPCKYVNELQYH